MVFKWEDISKWGNGSSGSLLGVVIESGIVRCLVIEVLFVLA
jgi:hypothetical protein